MFNNSVLWTYFCAPFCQASSHRAVWQWAESSPGVAYGQHADPVRDSTGVPCEGSFFTLPMGEPIGQIRLCPWSGLSIICYHSISRGYLQPRTVPVRPRREVWSVSLRLLRVPLKPAMQIVPLMCLSQMIPAASLSWS